ncbi:hypothetical protein BGY98DRAFT_1104604 [Russula aff. rugulosa BPL654]|nr:hypothetical protein BGY98DRAFT_1104604 [Russula aff. rugulosa BPL654]
MEGSDWSASRGTSPVNSDADVVYEVQDSDDDVVLEKPAESAQAELDRLAKEWISPIYVFFRHVPRIKYIDNH